MIKLKEYDPSYRCNNCVECKYHIKTMNGQARGWLLNVVCYFPMRTSREAYPLDKIVGCIPIDEDIKLTPPGWCPIK